MRRGVDHGALGADPPVQGTYPRRSIYIMHIYICSTIKPSIGTSRMVDYDSSRRGVERAKGWTLEFAFEFLHGVIKLRYDTKTSRVT